MKILAFDTSNLVLSVAICEDEKTIATFNSSEKKTHSVTLLPAIKKLLVENNLEVKDIEKIVVAQGPGSFTGIRIAVTTAKMLAWTLNIPLVGISSLALIASNITDKTSYIIPYFDARRSNVFAGIYKWENKELKNIVADGHWVIDDLILEMKKLDGPVIFVGTSIEELTSKATGSNVTFSEKFEPRAENLVKLAKNEPEVADIHAFIPKYLRYTKAEYDWLRTQGEEMKDNNEDYVEKV